MPVQGEYIYKTGVQNAAPVVGDYVMLKSGQWARVGANGSFSGPYSVVDGVGNLATQPIYTYTWAQTLALTGQVAGNKVIVSDLGNPAYSIWTYNGTYWTNPNPVMLAQSALPIIYPSSGTIGNNGALTLTTALPSTFEAAFMYFPANAIAAGVAAGLYYVVMSSTTVGVIYNNTFPSSGIAEIPASPTAFVTTGPGAYTQTTASDILVAAIPVQANSMGPRGAVDLQATTHCLNNANAKQWKLWSGTLASLGGAGQIGVWADTGLAGNVHRLVMSNRGIATRQSAGVNNGGGYGGSSLGPINGTRDTTALSYLLVSANMATATDYMIIAAYSTVLLNS